MLFTRNFPICISVIGCINKSDNKLLSWRKHVIRVSMHHRSDSLIWPLSSIQELKSLKLYSPPFPKYEKYYRIRESLTRSPCWLLKHWKNIATLNITHGNSIEANKRAKVCDNLVNLIRPRWFMSEVNEWREPNHEWVTRTELLYYCDETSFILKSNYLQSDYHWIICVPHFKTLWGPK